MTDDEMRGLVHAHAIRDFRRTDGGAAFPGRVISRFVAADAEPGAPPSAWLVRDEAGGDHAIVATEWNVLPR